MQLQRLWQQRSKLGLPSSARDFLHSLPDGLAKSDLGVEVHYVPEIPSGGTAPEGRFETAGFIDRRTRHIVIASKFEREQQRFTLAHEVGHWLLHTGMVYHRDRPLSDAAMTSRRPLVEMEADLFAAELLMPRKFLLKCFVNRFGSKSALIDSNEALQALADAVNARAGLDIVPRVGERRISAEQLSALRPLDRARVVARASVFGSVSFQSLASQFEVSATAMAIQLLDAGLVN